MHRRMSFVKRTNKQRGLRRKCKEMERRIAELTEAFPQPHDNRSYWHLHLPVYQDFIDSANTPFGVRRLCVQALVNHAHKLAAIAPPGQLPTRVVAASSLPELWASQIIVFFGAEYFDTFFDRDTDDQRWTRLPQKRSLVREWSINTPKEFSEVGYLEEVNDEDCEFVAEQWFIGQLTGKEVA